MSPDTSLICGYGFAFLRVINEGFTHLSTTAMGTVSHQAPELMRSGRLSKQADVFSFGVISEWPHTGSGSAKAFLKYVTKCS